MQRGHKIRQAAAGAGAAPAPATNDENTVLLLHADGDVGNTGHAITVNGTPILDADKPIAYGTRADPNSAFGASARFNGTDAYLSIADSADWDIAGSTSQDYTIDLWVKHDNIANLGGYFQQFEDSSNYWGLYNLDATTGVRFRVYSAASAIVELDGPGLSNNKWHHVAVVKKTSAGPTVEWGLYIDGVQVAYTSDTDTDTFSGALRIGQLDTSGTPANFMAGYMDELRITTTNSFSASPNVGLTDTITVPTAPYTSDANTKLLLHFSDLDQGETPATITDSGNTGHTVTNVSSKVSGITWWWTGAMDFDGSTDYLTVPFSGGGDFDFGSGNFTVDFWYNHDTGTTQRLFSMYDGSINVIFGRPNGEIYFNTDGTDVSATPGTAPASGVWHHFAMVRNSTTMYLFIDGIQILNESVSGTMETGSISTFSIGAFENSGSAGQYFNGKIAEFRVSKGLARWTSGFTPPTSPYTSDANTQFLYHAAGNAAIGASANHDLTFANTGLVIAQDSNAAGFEQSYDFDGSTDYLTIPDSDDWDVVGSTSQDYTIDFWVKHTDHAAVEAYVSQSEDANNNWRLRHLNGTGLQFQVASGGILVVDFTASEITDTNWHHVALCKVTSGGPTVEWGIYVDGTQTGYLSDTSTATFAAVLQIAGRGGAASLFDGNLDELRIQKSNIFGAAPNVGTTDTITVPTAPYDTE